ncbi:Uncharacterised protein [Mycobacteroides abscessus subsp. abscessus]|nr:Uncharacterised protein [Mycobacteroides abscessus subsp. abscessus]
MVHLLLKHLEILFQSRLGIFLQLESNLPVWLQCCPFDIIQAGHIVLPKLHLQLVNRQPYLFQAFLIKISIVDQYFCSSSNEFFNFIKLHL